MRTYFPLDKIEQTSGEDHSDYIKKMILIGNKIQPPTITKEGKILDGKKKVQSYREIGLVKNIEVFIGTKPEGDELLEGLEDEPSGGLVLAESANVRLEERENIHLHYGEGGKFRVIMGKQDFKLLAKAVLWDESIEL